MVAAADPKHQYQAEGFVESVRRDLNTDGEVTTEATVRVTRLVEEPPGTDSRQQPDFVEREVVAATAAILGNENNAVTRVPAIQLTNSAGTLYAPPAQIYQQTVFGNTGTAGTSSNWLGQTINANPWMNDVTFTTTGSTTSTDIINVSDQVIRFPLKVDNATGATFNFDNIVFDTGTNIRWDSDHSEFFGVDHRDPKAAFKRRLRNQHRFDIRKELGHLPRATRRGADFRDAQANEILALQLLRSMVGPDVFRKFLKYGFVTTKGPSGLTYQVARKDHIITVWDQGTKVATLCVYLKDKTIPPTDEVVAKMIICECDEPDIWKRANVSWYKYDERSNRVAEAVGIRPPSTALGDVGFRIAHDGGADFVQVIAA